MRDLLPPNSSKLEMALADIAWQSINIDFPLRDLHDPDKCPESVLPFLAWQRSVDIWNDKWPVALKRQVVKSAIKIHKHKGTIGALKNALKAIDMDIKILEWFEYDGRPFTFHADINLVDRAIDKNEIKTIAATIKMAKNTRSHLDQLRTFQIMNSPIPKISMWHLMAQQLTIFPKVNLNTVISNSLPNFAMAVQYIQNITIFPKINLNPQILNHMPVFAMATQHFEQITISPK